MYEDGLVLSHPRMELEFVWVCGKRLHLRKVVREERACKRVSGPSENHTRRVKIAKAVMLSEFACECWKVFDLVMDFLPHRIERGCLTQRSPLTLPYRCHPSRSISSRIACIGG